MSIRMRGFVFGMAVVAGSFGVVRGQEGGFEPPKLTAEHKALAEEVGVWDAEMFFFVPGQTEPMPAGKGVETNTLLPGGLWLLSEYKSDPGAGAFEGRGQTGYDPKRAKYVGSWVDSMSPRLLILEGTYDAKTKTATMLGDGENPFDGSPTSIKTTTHQPDANTRTFTMFSKPKDGKETEFTKMLEIRYKKRP